MDNITCKYEMNLIREHEQMEQDILAGRGMDILCCLLDGANTEWNIATRLEMPVYSVKLYIKRFLEAGLVKEEAVIHKGQNEKKYQLVSDDIEIINCLGTNNMSDAEKKRKAEMSAQHFAVMTGNAIRNVNKNDEKPHKIKVYFIKTNEENMNKFKEEIDRLFEKYQNLEDKDAKETYSLFTVLAPYEMEE